MTARKIKVYNADFTGTEIKKIRKKRDITADEFAYQIGCSTNHLYNVESGRTEPSIDLIMNISRILQIPLDQLLFEEETQVPMSVDDLKKRVNKLIEAYENTQRR
ncbi:MAG: helix-turn-helix domain-containing protein [Bulleidia sp.]